MATNQGDEEIGDEEEEGHDCEDNPRPELGLLGSVLLFDLHQVLGGGHDLRGGDHNGPNLDEEELEKAEGAVVGDRVEPGIRHGDVSHLLTFWYRHFDDKIKDDGDDGDVDVCVEDGAYLIIVTDTTDAVSVNFSGRCKFLQI